MNRVTRGEKIVQRLVDDGAISRCGADWLVAAVDPFHDKQLANLQGWPDLQTGSSVVRFIKQSVTVAVPSTVPNGSNWDCHIVQWPWLNPSLGTFSTSVNRLGQTYTYNSPVINFAQVGGLQAYGAVSGDPLSIMLQNSTRIVGSLSIDPTYTQGAGRLIGLGFEVHNTTSQLNLQGSVCVYRQMALGVQPNTFKGNSVPAGTSFTYTGVPVRYPPATLANALLLQGSRQWEAKEGCYVVAAFDDCENPAKPMQPMAPVILGSGQDDLEGATSTAAINAVNPGATIGTYTDASCPNMRVHPIQQSGAIFTGLSYTSTLTINWNVIYESFPALSQVDILPLATPSCEYDPDAMDLYERIIQDMPVGVMVKENGLGDWFLGAVSDAAKFVSPLMKTVPYAAPFAPLVEYVGNTAASYRDKNPPNTWEKESGIVNQPVATRPKRKTKKKAQTVVVRPITQKTTTQAPANRARQVSKA